MENLNRKISDEERHYYSVMEQAFAQLAPFYDVGTAPISRIREKAASFPDSPKGSTVLDVATGTGKQAFAFAKKGYNVIGIDLSGAMLKKAKKNNMYRRADFEKADAARLPFQNNTFDISTVSFALHEMPYTIRERALKEMVRVTKPEGTIIIVDYALPRNRVCRFFIYNLIKLYESEYYSEFVKSDFEKQLKKIGIEVEARTPLLRGAGIILKGTRMGRKPS